LRTAATSACNVGVWEDHRRPSGHPAPVAPRDARRRSFTNAFWSATLPTRA